VTAGVRPEDFRLIDMHAAEGIGAQVKVCEFTGADTQLICTAGEQEIIVILRERVNLQPGDPVRLAANGVNLHLFDTGSGKRLP